ncbi:MAG: arsenate reductase ArsC [Planctomycetota bacterium]
MIDHPNILVLCTGNSCRSQIAEGYLHELASARFNILSAGTEPKDFVHPMAIAVMAEDGIDISHQRPKHLKEYLGRIAVRYLMIVCSGANEGCPRIWPGMLNRVVWPFDDPAAFVGTDDETIAEFRRVRDEIKLAIRVWLADI